MNQIAKENVARLDALSHPLLALAKSAYFASVLLEASPGFRREKVKIVGHSKCLQGLPAIAYGFFPRGGPLRAATAASGSGVYALNAAPSGRAAGVGLTPSIAAAANKFLPVGGLRSMFVLTEDAWRAREMTDRAKCAALRLGPGRSPARREAARRERAERERRVVGLLNGGLSMAEIAAREGITERGMRKYVRAVIARRGPEATEPPDPSPGVIAVQVTPRIPVRGSTRRCKNPTARCPANALRPSIGWSESCASLAAITGSAADRAEPEGAATRWKTSIREPGRPSPSQPRRARATSVRRTPPTASRIGRSSAPQRDEGGESGTEERRKLLKNLDSRADRAQVAPLPAEEAPAIS
jgi:DNA-binding CsgD family transcriptional regulator